MLTVSKNDFEAMNDNELISVNFALSLNALITSLFTLFDCTVKDKSNSLHNMSSALMSEYWNNNPIDLNVLFEDANSRQNARELKDFVSKEKDLLNASEKMLIDLLKGNKQ